MGMGDAYECVVVVAMVAFGDICGIEVVTFVVESGSSSGSSKDVSVPYTTGRLWLFLWDPTGRPRRFCG